MRKKIVSLGIALAAFAAAYAAAPAAADPSTCPPRAQMAGAICQAVSNPRAVLARAPVHIAWL
jgi:hypothetical protein